MRPDKVETCHVALVLSLTPVREELWELVCCKHRLTILLYICSFKICLYSSGKFTEKELRINKSNWKERNWIGEKEIELERKKLNWEEKGFIEKAMEIIICK